MTIISQLVLNPAILSLVAGVFVGVFAPLQIPQRLVSLVSWYLIFSIGFKGGMCLGVADRCSFSTLVTLGTVGIIIGFMQPFVCDYILKKTTHLDMHNRTVIATQYGSISIVTFISAVTFLNKRLIPYDTFMSAIAVIMEVPALLSGLVLLKRDQGLVTKNFLRSLVTIVTAIATCRTIVCIVAGFAVGLTVQYLQYDAMSGTVLRPFTIVLVLFMFEIGMKIAAQREYVKKISPSLIAFGLYMPVISGTAALFVASRLGYTLGSVILFALLIASASYIAVPAVMRTQARQAQEVIYLPLALGVTLPFNVLVGIPLFYYLATLVR